MTKSKLPPIIVTKEQARLIRILPKNCRDWKLLWIRHLLRLKLDLVAIARIVEGEKYEVEEAPMDDYRGEMCLIEGKYLAKCISQDFYTRTLTFEVEPDGDTFTREGDYGVEIYVEKESTFDDVKHRLPTIDQEEE